MPEIKVKLELILPIKVESVGVYTIPEGIFQDLKDYLEANGWVLLKSEIVDERFYRR